MDGENNGKPYFLMGDLGGKPIILGNPINMFQKRTTSETGSYGWMLSQSHETKGSD